VRLKCRLTFNGLQGIIFMEVKLFITTTVRTSNLEFLVVRVLGYRSGGPSSIPGTTSGKKSSGSGTGSTQPREYN
jgi:hypothetical protein